MFNKLSRVKAWKRVFEIVLLPVFLGLGLTWGVVQAAQAGQAAPVEQVLKTAGNAPASIDLSSLQNSSMGITQHGPRLVQADEHGIVLDLGTPDFRFEQRSIDGLSCQVIQVDGYGTTDQSGWPRLPVRGAMAGIPHQSIPQLTVIEAKPVKITGNYDLCPVDSPVFEHGADGEQRYQGQALIRDDRAYALDGFSPESPAVLFGTGFVRSQRLAQVRFQPFQYNPASGELRYYPHIRVRLDYGLDEKSISSNLETGTTIDEGPFETLLRDTLVNYAAARQWRVQPVSTAAPQGNQAAAASVGYKLLVNRDSIYQVSYEDLLAAGADLSGVDPDTFRLVSHGAEAAIQVQDGGDGVFDSGDMLLFYGEQVHTKYTDTNVYYLTWGGTQGLRMASLDGAPYGASLLTEYLTTTHWERHLLYMPGDPSGPDDDVWYGDIVSASSGPRRVTYTIPLNNIAITPGLTATVHGLLKGFSTLPEDALHHTQIYLNGYLLEDATWEAREEYSFTSVVSQTFLVDGNNAIRLVILRDLATSEWVLINWFEIGYWRKFVSMGDMLNFSGTASGNSGFEVTNFTTNTLDILDITDPFHVARVMSATIQWDGTRYKLNFEQDLSSGERHYLAQAANRRLSPAGIVKDLPSSLQSTGNRADYIVITHADFYTNVLPLAQWRASQGLRTMVVKADDIYDEFNDGVLHPKAIHDFLAYAYANWQQPAPSYVLIVGDGNQDPKHYRSKEQSYIPPYLIQADPWMGEVSAENRFVTVSGEDTLPDMHLGRLPVNTYTETATVVAKILAYEQIPPATNWNSQVVFVADNADSAGDFVAFSNAVADHYLPEGYSAQKIYYMITHSSISEARSAIINAINQGALMVNYIGHASIQYWANEKLFSLTSVAALTNTQRLPFMVPMTCQEGIFYWASYGTTNNNSVSEVLLRKSDGGAIGSFAPLGLGVASGHDFLNRGLYQAILYDGVTQVGPATTLAKLYLAANSTGFEDLLDTYTVLGDPATRLNVLPAELGIRKTADAGGFLTPGSPITYTLTYSNAGQALATHVVITDILPVGLENTGVITSGAAITPRAGSPFVWDAVDLAPGEGGKITVTARVRSDFAGILSNQASIATVITETSLANNVSGLVQNFVHASNVGIRKQATTDGFLESGDVITYTLVYSNAGPDTATQVVILDPLSAQLENAVVTSSGVAITLRPASRYIWDVANLAPGEGGTITIRATVNPRFAGSLSNQASISAALPDQQSDNNIASVASFVHAADLGIHKTASASVLQPGEVITYTLVYSNSGPDLATGVVITDILPDSLENLSVLSSGAAITQRPGSSFVWNVADLAAGQGGVITITAVVPLDYRGALANSASIASSVADNHPEDDSVGPVLSYVNIADLFIESQGPASAAPGNLVTYRLDYGNQGTALAEQVVITALLPVELYEIQASYTGISLSPRPGQPFVWDVGTLPPDQGGIITITARVNWLYSGLLSTTTSIAGSSLDGYTGNNANTWVLQVLDRFRQYLPIAFTNPLYNIWLLPVNSRP